VEIGRPRGESKGVEQGVCGTRSSGPAHVEDQVSRQISLASPDITEAEIEAVTAVLRTPSLSLGPKLAEFEQTFTERLGVKHAIATSSGTTALHLLWRALGVGPGDEVVTTPFSFISSSNSILFDGGRVVFVDIDPETWQIDVGQIESAITPKTKALLPVDVFGSIPDMDAIWSLARKHGLRVLEDSCEALGANYKGRPAGTLGEAGTFGFYPNKQITTGEGGMIVTDDDQIAFLARSMRNQGRDPDAGWLQHARLGFNYRISDINCALGIVQMHRLDEMLAKRSEVAHCYLERIASEPRLTMMKIPDDVQNAWFVFVVRLSDDYSQRNRDEILVQLRRAGIGCSNYFTPIHLQPFYREQLGYKPGDFPIAEALSARTIALPFHTHLSEADVDAVTSELIKLL
jgi:perosamine synthetase